MICILAMFIVAGIAKVFDLDQTNYVLVPKNQEFQLELNCDYMNQNKWVVQDYDERGFHLKVSRKKGPIGVKGVDTYTVYYAHCDDKCVLGKSFRVTFSYKNVFSEEILEDKNIVFKVVDNNSEYL